MKAATAAEDVSRSKFSGQLRSYVENLNNHIKIGVKEGHSVETFLPGLLSDNDDISMTLLWFLIDPVNYLPKLTISFLKWPIPTVNLEFDHKGCWKEISSSHYFYEGAESKGTYDNCTELPPDLFR
jgi:hypothetical protein